MGIQQLLIGGGRPSVEIDDQTALSSNTGVQANARYRLENDGRILATSGNDTLVHTGDWLINGDPDDYEVRDTLQSGEPPVGLNGSWQSLGTDQQWSLLTMAGAGQRECELLIEIRRAGGGVIDSAYITIISISN